MSLLAALVLGGMGAHEASISYHLVTAGRQTQGTVVDYERRRGSKGGTMLAPVVRFTTDSGSVVIKGSKSSSAHPPWSVGDTVKVYYEPTDPEVFRLDSFVDLWLGPVAMGLIAAFFLASAALVWRRSS